MLLNFRKIYFAFISTVSIIVVGVTAVYLFKFSISTVFPDLIISDMEHLKEISSDDDAGANAFLQSEVRPLNSEIVSDVIRMVIFYCYFTGTCRVYCKTRKILIKLEKIYS